MIKPLGAKSLEARGETASNYKNDKCTKLDNELPLQTGSQTNQTLAE